VDTTDLRITTVNGTNIVIFTVYGGMSATSGSVAIVNGTCAVIVARDESVLTTFDRAASVRGTSVIIITIDRGGNTAYRVITTIVSTFRLIITDNFVVVNSSFRDTVILSTSIGIVNIKGFILATFFSITSV
jgi:hypothetical protein